MTYNYDIVVLGGGTGGYVAAIRAAQLGFKTAIVEKEKLGGTCLHKGCIPSKALLRSAEVFATAKNANAFGVHIESATIDFAAMQNRKNKIVTRLYNGVNSLIQKNKIDVYEGKGRILGPSIFSPTAGTISVEYDNGKENTLLIPDNVIIATGSRPKTIPGLDIDNEYILSSDEALQLQELPRTILIVGGGVIGIEWASLLADLGVEVTIIEAAQTILPTEDEEISKEMARMMKKKGINIITNAVIQPDSLQKNGNVTVDVNVAGNDQTFSAEKILVSVGRKANIEDIGLNNTSIQLKDGCIETNSYFQTKESHIYAIGDVRGGLQLAHVAAKEGIIAIEHIANKNPLPLDESFVPRCIYSYPEAARVGLTEQEAKEQGYQVKIGKIPFQAIGKALIVGEADGFVKVIADEKTNDILGVHMIGPHVTDYISEAGLARVLNASPWEIGQTVHPHPSLSEALYEAALHVDGNAIHY